MNFVIKMLMKLIGAFVPIDPEDYSRITGRAKDWAASIRIDDEPDNKTPSHLKAIGKFFDGWGVQLGICVAYIFAFDYMQNLFRDGKSKDDDDDDKD